jgi:hypothetical protein
MPTMPISGFSICVFNTPGLIVSSCETVRVTRMLESLALPIALKNKMLIRAHVWNCIRPALGQR